MLDLDTNNFVLKKHPLDWFDREDTQVELTGRPSHFRRPEERSFVHRPGCALLDLHLWMKGETSRAVMSFTEYSSICVSKWKE